VTAVIRVGVLGADGRMGREVCRAVDEAPDLELAAMVDPAFGASGGGGPAGGGGPRPGPLISGTVTALGEAGVEVAVDFTTADAARRSLPWCAEHGIHAVVGTTGLGDDDLAMLARAFSGDPANVVVASNFAIGAVLMMRFCEMAAPLMDGAEIVELHHDAKRDAPSGTALRTAERIASARAAAGARPFGGDSTTEMVLPGARGGESRGGVHVHAVRLPGLVAHQEVLFGASGQSLTIRHDSYDRRSFMPGVLLAVRAVGSRPGCTIGLEPLLAL
jgi:4-hydroxy-tetrahydrodipicolinate reductase